MNVIEAIKKRQSVRAYLPRAVEPEKLLRILDVARYAPSGVNTQPWQVAVVGGATKERLQQQLEAEYRRGEPARMDYQYYPERWEEPYRARRRACGLKLYGAVGIGREDTERQLDQRAANFRAFDAPLMLFFFMDPVMSTGSYLDYGMFLQTLMLAAVAEGLATCPQASVTEYPEIVKKVLEYPEDSVLVCGLALGYADERHPINDYRTEREKVESFTRFFN